MTHYPVLNNLFDNFKLSSYLNSSLSKIGFIRHLCLVNLFLMGYGILFNLMELGFCNVFVCLVLFLLFSLVNFVFVVLCLLAFGCLFSCLGLKYSLGSKIVDLFVGFLFMAVNRFCLSVLLINLDSLFVKNFRKFEVFFVLFSYFKNNEFVDCFDSSLH